MSMKPIPSEQHKFTVKKLDIDSRTLSRASKKLLKFLEKGGQVPFAELSRLLTDVEKSTLILQKNKRSRLKKRNG